MTLKKDKVKDNVITAYKGFNKGLICRNHKFEVGKTYRASGKIECCTNGFHACTNPKHIEDHYNFDESTTDFAIVEQWGNICNINDDKQASEYIKVVKVLSFTEFMKIVREFRGAVNTKRVLISSSYDIEDMDGTEFINKVEGAYIIATDEDYSGMDFISEAKNATVVGDFNSFTGKLGCVYVNTNNNEVFKIDGKKYKPDVRYETGAKGLRKAT